MRKLNQILIEWKERDLHSLKWLKDKGISQGVAYEYFQNGTLEKLGPGVYVRKGEKPSWWSGVRLLQEEYGKEIYVSGRTALELHGHAHYATVGDSPVVFITSNNNSKIPKWFNEIKFDCKFQFNNSKLFKSEMEIVDFFYDGRIKIKISSRERAILEFIDMLDLRYSFETAENYTTGLVGLRVDVLQRLLEACNSVKVKRVFLFLAEKLNYDYFKKLNLDKIDLGKGKRQIVIENSTYDKKYKITVPKDYGENPF